MVEHLWDWHLYLLAPPASGETIVQFFHSGMFSLIHFRTAGSAYKLSTGMSKNPWRESWQFIIFCLNDIRQTKNHTESSFSKMTDGLKFIDRSIYYPMKTTLKCRQRRQDNTSALACFTLLTCICEACKSIVMIWSAPDTDSMFATNLAEIGARLWNRNRLL